MQKGGAKNEQPKKLQTKKGQEFNQLKIKGQTVKQISKSVYAGVNGDQQQQTDSMPSSTDAMSAVSDGLSVTSA